MITNDPQLHEFHARAERNSKQMLKAVCEKCLKLTPPSERAAVSAALTFVQDTFATTIKARDLE